MAVTINLGVLTVGVLIIFSESDHLGSIVGPRDFWKLPYCGPYKSS